MKIAIPIEEDKGLDSEISEHFGRSKFFIVIDENGNVLEKIENIEEHKKKNIHPPAILKTKGVEVILASSIGYHALELSKALKIEVYLGEARTVREILEKYKKGELKKVA